MSLLSDGIQLWAYVGKVTHLVEGAGLNTVPWIWTSTGFVPQGVDEMDIEDIVYSAMRDALVRGAARSGIPYIANDSWTTVGRYIVYSERYVTWENGYSVDPSILKVFKDEFGRAFASSAPDTSSTYLFVRAYLANQERVFNFDFDQDASDLLEAFDAGTTQEEWAKMYEKRTRGLVSRR